MTLKIIFNLSIFASILFLPWWLTVIIAISFLFMFTSYEVILWGLFADILYSSPVLSFFNIEFLFTIVFIMLFIVVYFIKNKLIFYPYSKL